MTWKEISEKVRLLVGVLLSRLPMQVGGEGA
jgi:hypothetical protein